MNTLKFLLVASAGSLAGTCISQTAILAYQQVKFARCFDQKMETKPIGKTTRQAGKFLYECYFPEMPKDEDFQKAFSE